MSLYSILSLLINIFSVFIFVIPLYLIISRKNMNKFVKLLSSLFIIYIIAVFSLVGIPSIDYMKIDLGFNFIPFIDIISSPKSALLNILLFIPLGIFLPMLWKEEYNEFLKTLIFGFIFSLCIEVLQVLTFRLSDINDLITNTIGTIVGYLLYSKFLKHNKFMIKKNISEKLNPVIIIFVIFIVMFFISSFISNAIWDLIL